MTYLSWGSVWFWHSCSKPQSPWEFEHPPPELQYLHKSQLTSATLQRCTISIRSPNQWLTLPQCKLLIRRLSLRLSLGQQLFHSLGAFTEVLRNDNVSEWKRVRCIFLILLRYYKKFFSFQYSILPLYSREQLKVWVEVLDAGNSSSRVFGFWGAPGDPTSLCCEEPHERRGAGGCGKQGRLSGFGFPHVWMVSAGGTEAGERG